MSNEPLKFFRVEIKVYPAIAPLRQYAYDENDFDLSKAKIADEPIISHTENIVEATLADSLNYYLEKLIKDRMYEIGSKALYDKCPDKRLLEEM